VGIPKKGPDFLPTSEPRCKHIPASAWPSANLAAYRVDHPQ